MLAKLAHTLLVPMVAQIGYYFPAQDTSWQAQFAGAVKWSALGVNDDSGGTDNTTALQALPANTPIIGDCPHGGFVQYAGTWSWPSGLTVWQQPGCVLKSTITTPGVYPITNAGGFTATQPITNVQYYGMQFSFVTPTSTVRMMLAWIDHLKFKYFDVNGSGGFAFLRGSDQEVAFGTMENTQTAAGNPGIRHFGNVPKVAASPGMRANDWFHNLNFQTGDGSFQTCQPSNNPATWGYGVSSDDILYENSYGNSISSTLILVNEYPLTDGNYTCNNIRYVNVSGSGRWLASIGNSNLPTTNVSVTGGAFDGSASNQAVALFGIGASPIGGVAATNPNVSNVTVSDVTITGEFQRAFDIIGANGVALSNVTIGAPRVGSSSTAATMSIDKSTGVTFTGGSVAAGNNAQGIVDGPTGTSIGTQISGVTVTGVTDAKVGISLQNSVGASVTSSVVSPKSGSTTAIGIALKANPNGTNNATVTGNDVSAMPVPIICATGQGNNVTGNTGAADCAP